MALPSSGKISSLDVYQEYHGNSATPTGGITLDALRVLYSLGTGILNTSIWYGLGRAEGETDPPSAPSMFGFTANGDLFTTGGFTTDYRWRYKNKTSGTWLYTTNSSTTSAGTKSKSVSISASSGQTWEVEFQFRNECVSNAWLFGGIIEFVIP